MDGRKGGEEEGIEKGEERERGEGKWKGKERD